MTGLKHFHWRTNGKIMAFVAFFLPLTLGLGYWQLERADGKREIIAELEARQSMPALTVSDFTGTPDQHLRRVSLDLELDDQRYLLLANSLIGGTVGYEVLAVGQHPSLERPVLVNRGWVQASLDRAERPAVEMPDGIQAVQGTWYCAQDNRMIANVAIEAEWPAVLYEINDEALGSLFPSPRPSSCVLRVFEDSPLAYFARWTIVNQSVEKHLGYAVQWFLMATALIILALFANSNLGDLLRGRTTKSES